MILSPEFLSYVVSGREFPEIWKAEARPAVTFWRSLGSEATRGWWRGASRLQLVLFSWPALSSSGLLVLWPGGPGSPAGLRCGLTDTAARSQGLYGHQLPFVAHFKGCIGWPTTRSWNFPFLMFQEDFLIFQFFFLDFTFPALPPVA